MYVMGLGGSGHDYSACLVKDGEVVVAIAEERITRKKYALGVNLLFERARKYCLKEAGITLDDVEVVVATDLVFPSAYYGCRKKTRLMNHHLSHAASAFYPSGFTESAILVVDGTGSVMNTGKGQPLCETVSYCIGNGSSIEILDRVVGRRYECHNFEEDTENSLGTFYKLASEYLGLGTYGTGKVMGLSGWGTNRFYPLFRNLIDLREKGQFSISRNAYHEMKALIENILGETSDTPSAFQDKADIATAVQLVLEDTLLHCVDYLRDLTGSRNICIAGGVGLNSVANWKMFKHGQFENIYIQPASSDDGTAIGCALQGYAELNPGRPILPNGMSVYLGREYAVHDIEEALEQRGDQIIWSRPNNLVDNVASILSSGKIVGWFQGRSEFGPRALGNRSILADPRLPHMKDELNIRIKDRETFRPFAPAVPLDSAHKYFTVSIPSPHMLLVCDVKLDMRSMLPAITHADGTARVQTVTQDENGLLYELLKSFGQKTGYEVLLNTSFNGRDEPIVETPAEGISCFLANKLDYLVLGSFLISPIG